MLRGRAAFAFIQQRMPQWMHAASDRRVGARTHARTWMGVPVSSSRMRAGSPATALVSWLSTFFRKWACGQRREERGREPGVGVSWYNTVCGTKCTRTRTSAHTHFPIRY